MFLAGLWTCPDGLPRCTSHLCQAGRPAVMLGSSALVIVLPWAQCRCVQGRALAALPSRMARRKLRLVQAWCTSWRHPPDTCTPRNTPVVAVPANAATLAEAGRSSCRLQYCCPCLLLLLLCMLGYAIAGKRSNVARSPLVVLQHVNRGVQRRHSSVEAALVLMLTVLVDGSCFPAVCGTTCSTRRRTRCGCHAARCAPRCSSRRCWRPSRWRRSCSSCATIRRVSLLHKLVGFVGAWLVLCSGPEEPLRGDAANGPPSGFSCALPCVILRRLW